MLLSTGVDIRADSDNQNCSALKTRCFRTKKISSEIFTLSESALENVKSLKQRVSRFLISGTAIHAPWTVSCGILISKLILTSGFQYTDLFFWFLLCYFLEQELEKKKEHSIPKGQLSKFTAS